MNPQKPRVIVTAEGKEHNPGGRSPLSTPGRRSQPRDTRVMEGADPDDQRLETPDLLRLEGMQAACCRTPARSARMKST